MGQRVARVLDEGERGVRVVRPVVGCELPPLPDPLERRLVDQCWGRADEAFVPLEHLRAVDHEVAATFIVADPAPGDYAVLRSAQARNPVGFPRSHRLGVVGAGRMPDQEVRRPVSDVPGDVDERVEDVLGTPQVVGGRRPTHPGKVWTDPPEPRQAFEARLEACPGLAMVHPGTVQHEHPGHSCRDADSWSMPTALDDPSWSQDDDLEPPGDEFGRCGGPARPQRMRVRRIILSPEIIDVT